MSVYAVNACGQGNTVTKQVNTSYPLSSPNLFVEQQPCDNGAPGVVRANAYQSNSGTTCYWSSDIGYVVPGPNGDAQVYTPYGYGFPINVSVYMVNDCGVSSTQTVTMYNQQCFGARSSSNPLQATVTPNPVQGSGTLSYTLTDDAEVSLDIVSVAALKQTRIVSSEKQRAGKNTLTFDTSNLGAGAYTARLVAQTKAGRAVVSMVSFTVSR